MSSSRCGRSSTRRVRYLSRSIHENWSRRYLRQHGYDHPADWFEQADKSELKRQVRRERRSAPQPTVPVSSAQVAFSVEDLPPGCFFPAPLGDIKGVMDELPPGFLNGVARVELRADRDFVDSFAAVEGQEVDPGTQKNIVEFETGVYAPTVLGTFTIETGYIRLFAYAAGESDELSETTRLTLRIRMLETLVHELCHNYDKIQRVARGRWRLNGVAKAEAYADRLTRVLLHSVVVPYLRRTYRPG